MIPELMKMAKAGALDLDAREEMGLFSLANSELSEDEFMDMVCEIASEHIPPPADKSVESFDLLVGAIISGFFAYKATQILNRLRDSE